MSLSHVGAYTRQTRAYEPDDPALRKKKISKLKLGELEHITREVRDLHKALMRALPESVFEPGFVPKLRDLLHRYVAMDLDLWLHSVRVLRRSELKGLIPGTTFLAVIGLAPLSEKIIVEVDLRFVYRVVDKLLGGNGIAIDIHRPLTEIEQGVFSYVVLKALALFQEAAVSPEQVALRLEDMRHDLRATADIVRHEDLWICASWKLNFDLDVGYVRALVPASLARRVLTQFPPADSVIMQRLHNRIRQRMVRLAGVTVEASIQAGRIELTKTDIRALDEGDIVLLEGSQLRIGGGQLSGRAQMTLGTGRRGILHGALQTQGHQVVFTIERIEISPAPAEHDPVVHHGEHANPEEVIAEYEDPHPGDEANDGAGTADDVEDEDYGIDDENMGDDEEYQEEGYEGEEGFEEQGGYSDQAYGEAGAGAEEVPIDDNDNLAEAEPLLGDIPVPVIVELGRVQLTADEVIRLRPGQIIELGRSPADPVDLVVAGKLLAKGELVEIEGALGVKLLSLVKDQG